MNRWLSPGAAIVGVVCCVGGASAKDFELTLSGHGQIRSFIYADRGPDNWIDTIIGLESEILRYQRTYLVFRFEDETDMGHGSEAIKAFDPNRGRWMFGVSSRTELQAHFVELLFRHDCFHGIDRYLADQDFKMSSFGFAFGSLGYLQKYRFRRGGSTSFPVGFDYLLMPALYVPKGEPWNRSPYLLRVEANARLDLVRWESLGFGLESANVFYYDADRGVVQRSHRLDASMFLYGTSAALLIYAGVWPYDNQVFRNRNGKVVAGLELSY